MSLGDGRKYPHVLARFADNREVFDGLAGLRKIKINWDMLRSFDPTPLLALEQELEEAVRQEYEARRMAHRSTTKEPKRRRRRGTATAEETPIAP